MGAEPYEYVVDYQEDIQAALALLRREVFQSGRYQGAEMNPASPQEALEMMEESGTASILDIERVTAVPGYFCAAPMSRDELARYFGTTEPTIELVTAHDEFWEDLARGQARYIVLYEDGIPTKIKFVGYSFD